MPPQHCAVLLRQTSEALRNTPLKKPSEFSLLKKCTMCTDCARENKKRGQRVSGKLECGERVFVLYLYKTRTKALLIKPLFTP